jgi:uncharacterized protein YukE
MTGILEVDTEALDRLAARIRAAANEAQAAAAHPGPLYSSIEALSAPVLIRAVGAFVESWRAALADIVDDSHRLADVITLAARSYHDAESAVSQRLLR